MKRPGQREYDAPVAYQHPTDRSVSRSGQLPPDQSGQPMAVSERTPKVQARNSRRRRDGA